MKLELFNEDFVRIGKISKYSYASYDCDSISYGKFLIKCASTEKLLAILPQVEYIYFEDDKVGVYNHESIEDVGVDEEITLKGYMIKSVLSYRTLYPQFSETLAPEAMLKTLVLQSFVENPNPEKNEPRMTIETIPEEVEDEEKLTLQVTGSDVFAECSKISKSEGVFFDFDVMMQNYDESSDAPANISELRFKTWKRRDCTLGNTEGNAPVVFSYSLSNIESSSFDESKENYKNVAIVAGEGEAELRKVVVLSDKTKRLEADEHTLCLLHFEDLKDAARPTITLSKGSTAVISNENPLFGGMCARFKSTGANSYFQMTNPQVPAGDFTIEWWDYIEAVGVTSAIFASRTDNTNGLLIWYGPTNDYVRVRAGSGNNTTWNIIPNNTLMGDKIIGRWVARAIVRDGTEVRMYQDGKLYNKITVTSTAKPTYTTNAWIGRYYGSSMGGVQGYIDEFRVSNICRYFGEEYELQSMPFNVEAINEYVIPKGLKRKELFVDARDLQSTDSRGKALVESEYRKLLLLRGLDKLSDYIVVRNVRATISSAGKQYVYGEDYKEGDIVTLALEPIGVTVDIPIAMVTKTQQGSLRYTDIVFGDVKSFIRNQLRKENLL